MQLDMTAQRAFCVRLGIIAADADFSAWYGSPQARDLGRLFEAMEKQAGKINEAARWMRSAMNTVDGRFGESDEIHTVLLHSNGEVGRHALDYDMAVAAYCELQAQVTQRVIAIRRDMGYEVTAFDRLEDHPVLSPAEDKARRDLAALEDHLAAAANISGMTRHLASVHSRKVTRAPQLRADEQIANLCAAHELDHRDELEALRATVAEIDPARLAAASTR
jgi:hypothetical protein